MKLLLRDLQAGQNYKIQVRSNDGQAVSEWSMIYDLTTSIDNTAPSTPTGLAVTQNGTVSVATWTAPTTSADGTVLMDFDHYDVEAYSDGTTAIYRTGIERFDFSYEYNVTLFGQYKTNTGFRVRAVDQSGNVSAWTTRVFGVDTAPSQPAAPILIKDLTDVSRPRLFVRHNLMNNAGTGRLETDVNRIKVYSTASSSATPTVVGSTLIGTMVITPAAVFGVLGTMNLNDYTGKHFFVVATDIAGNDSATSPTSPVSGASTGIFADIAIINEAYITYLEANKIVAGSGFIDNITIKSSFIMGVARDPLAPADTDGNAIPITQTVARSANYKYGTDGWIIRGDGYAEFRNLAVNSLNIGKFDQVTQSVMSTKFADFMEDSTLWGRHTTTGNEEETGGTPYDTGTFVGVVNNAGAYSGRAFLSLTGNTSVRRKSAGLNRGISFEPGQVYKVWARVRQLTGQLINNVNNPTFRGDTTDATTGDTAADGMANYWREYSSITGTKSLQTGITGPVGTVTTSQRLTGSIGAAGYLGVRANTPLLTGGEPNANALPVVPGLSYNLSAYFKASAIPGTGTAAVAIEWYDAAGSILSTSTEATQVIGTGVWVRPETTIVAPVGAAIAAPRLRFIGSSAGTLTVDITAVQFTQTTAVKTYFDGRSTYSEWSSTADASPSNETHTTKYRVGVLGFDDTGNLCAADGSTSADPAMHYMVASDGTVELPVFDGSQGQSAGWTEITGYIKDRTDEITAPGAHNDPYLPAGVHKNVRFIVPFVEMNINDNPVATDYVGQLDMFSIEASNTLAPVVLKTGTSKGITIQDLAGDDWSHAIRVYSGNNDEKYPALITEFQDQSFNSVHTLLISPPQTYDADKNSINEGISLRGRNANLISNSSFEYPFTVAGSYAAAEGVRFAILAANGTLTSDIVNFHQGWGEKSLKITSTASGASFGYHHLMSTEINEMIGNSKFTASAWVRSPATNPSSLNAGFFIAAYDDAGSLLVATPGVSTLTSNAVANTGEWVYITNTFDVSSTYPDGLPDSTRYINFGYGFTATAGAQIFNVDDIQFEVGITASDYKPQTPTTFRVGGAGTIVGGTLLVSDRIKAFDELSYTKWAAGIDYELDNPSIQVENDGLFATIEKLSSTAGGTTSSYTQFRVIDDQGVTQAPFIWLIDSNDQGNPNTIQIRNTNGFTMAKFGSMADPTNPEANAAAKDFIVYGSFKAMTAPNWTTVTGLNINLTDVGGQYSLSTFNSNGITYLRGAIKTGASGSTSSNVATIASGHRPATNVQIPVTFINASTYGVSIARIDTSGVISWYRPAGTAPLSTTWFFDGTAFSTAADSQAPDANGENPATIGAASQPTGLAIVPYASSTTTGTYKLTWSNANDADNAKLRIVWRTDRLPTSATDGTINTVATTPNTAQSGLLSGLPVNRTIYIRVYAINKAGVINSTSPPSVSRYLLSSPLIFNSASSSSYRDGYGGMWRNDGDQVYQGEWTGNDNHRGLWFYGTTIATKLGTGSVSRTPTKMTIYMQRTGSGGIYGGVGIDMYPHGHATRPAGKPTLPGSGSQNAASLKTNGAATVTIPSAWYAAFASGTYKGIGIFNGNSADYAILYGRSSGNQHGRITVYHKG